MKNMKRIIALTMALVMLTGLFSAVLAEEITEAPEVVTEEIVTTENVTEIVETVEIVSENVTEEPLAVVEETPVAEAEPEVVEEAPVVEVAPEVIEEAHQILPKKLGL